jgi:hypothetical protein
MAPEQGGSFIQAQSKMSTIGKMKMIFAVKKADRNNSRT